MAYTSINKPSSYFNTKLYTGTGSSNAITGVGFQPDLIWSKNRDSITNHYVVDVLRGTEEELRTNSPNHSAGDSALMDSIDSDGFTLGTSASMNTSSANYVSWNWLANGAGSSNTDGSITTTVSANQTSGFSIVKWTANISGAESIGHGLGVAPKVIILKALDTASDWVVGGFGLDWSGYLLLNGRIAFTNDSNDSSGTGRMFSAGGTDPTSLVFHHNSSAVVGSATNMIAYCFAEKKGFSKFGTYTGNGSTDGTFIYTGFKPAFVIQKNASDASTDWNIYDNKRSSSGGNNVINSWLYTNSSAAEVANNSTANNIDLLSNGFKLRQNNSDLNLSGKSYVYMAFAEHPLVSSTGTPCTAR